MQAPPKGGGNNPCEMGGVSEDETLAPPKGGADTPQQMESDAVSNLGCSHGRATPNGTPFPTYRGRAGVLPLDTVYTQVWGVLRVLILSR